MGIHRRPPCEADQADRGQAGAYESKTHGYEWFGADPGHEALTAFGLMEFRDMAKVYGDVDKAMLDRTRKWLVDRRDGKGGFKKNPHALHTWVADEVTDAYITYALAKTGEKDLEPELARQRATAESTKDPYMMALAANSLVPRARATAPRGPRRSGSRRCRPGMDRFPAPSTR